MGPTVGQEAEVYVEITRRFRTPSQRNLVSAVKHNAPGPPAAETDLLRTGSTSSFLARVGAFAFRQRDQRPESGVHRRKPRDHSRPVGAN